jgi:hypothetical protein
MKYKNKLYIFGYETFGGKVWMLPAYAMLRQAEILDIGYWILDIGYENDYFKEQEPLNKKWANTIVGGEKSEDKKLKE